ncbi:class I SAM-dependent methyltransferase [Glycomyces sp. TRM65418]|uniref:class I SAM-dependent methyltransferase n=1 Tax=Glycomyces sp. TRM65418 TaxID=2867006 RepID=UPI001CE57E36|nr:class I SAM-dependent methyltransferase [Glycomyces sp. TRM65418]MCC3763946.1 class I SAM-dependent methyltransferase [Glycomyces sp. TRM65418]QZD53646.1 class I SAM-dependent methyltransferase [Glycomyces sp. TRM65418]
MAAHGDHEHHEPTAAFDFAEAAPRFRERADAETDRYRRLAAQLHSPEDRVVADIGCGAASMAFALAEALPAARVIAVDAEPAMLDLVRERAAERGADVRAAQASVDDPDALAAAVGEPADLLWAGHVIHHAADPQQALAHLAGLLASGGRLAIGEGGVTAQFLPWHVGVGRPGLELRLIEAGSRRLENEAIEHGSTPLTYGWNLALERAGLTSVRTFSELVAIPVPLEGDDLAHALNSLAMRVDWFERYLTEEDGAAWAELLDETSPEWLGHRRDLHHLAIETVHVAAKP